MTPAGANFIRKTLDPFHDFEVYLEGLPDSNTSKVVIQEVTKSVNITNAGLGAGLWDCHIANFPELYSSGAVNNFQLNVFGTATALFGTAPTLGPVTYSTANTGNQTFTDQSGPAVAANINHVDFNEYTSGQKRVIALAFEVHNTTAELYKQGVCTTYRQPNANNLTNMRLIATDGISLIPTYGPVTISRLPPGRISDCLLLSGSRQWEAKEGCYNVCIMDIDQCVLEGSTFNPHTFVSGDNAGFVTTYGMLDFPISNQFFPSKLLPFHTSGAYFTGLSEQTTLTLTVRMILESCPTSENPQLVVLGKPSPNYDPLAIEIYKAASVQLPVAVMVKDNASGDFWEDVIDCISAGLSLAAPALGIPPGLVQMGANGVKKFGNTVQSMLNSSKKNKAKPLTAKQEAEISKLVHAVKIANSKGKGQEKLIKMDPLAMKRKLFAKRSTVKRKDDRLKKQEGFNDTQTAKEGKVKSRHFRARLPVIAE